MSSGTKQQERDFTKAVLDTVSALVVVLDLDGRITRFNQACATMTGYREDEVLGRCFWEFLIPPEDLPGVLATWRQLRAGDFPNRHENRWTAKDGSERLIAWSNTAIVRPTGEMQYIIGTGQDITERNQAEQERERLLSAIQKEKDRLMALFNSIQDEVWFADTEEKITLVNPAVLKEFGANGLQGEQVEKIAGRFQVFRPDGTLRPPDESPPLRALRGEVVEVEEEIVRTHENEDLRHRQVSAAPVKDAGGNIIGSVSIARDITQLKQAEESLRRNEARSRLLADTAGRLLATEEPKAMVDQLCRQVMVHLDCQAFFNFLIDEEAGRLHLNACAGIPEAEARKIEWLDYGVAVCGCVARDRARIIADDIFHIPDPRTDMIKSFGIQAYCCHPLMAHGHLIGTLSFGTKTRPHFSPEEVETMRIVTDQVAIAMDRIRLLDTIRRSRDDLEIRVRERTADLAHLSSQLVSAQENERRRISYDLHDNVWQTLVAIRFEIERLFSKLGKEGDAVLRKRSREVMADILGTVGKIRSMQGDLWPYALDDIGIVATLDWYCREFEKSHSGLVLERKNDLAESEIPPSAKIVIYRIMQETLNNVAKHSQASHVTLRLMKDDHEMEFAVEDNGIGFDPEETFARKNPWGGLGLLTIKARTELSGGVFGVESSKGKGTTVRASWPI